MPFTIDDRLADLEGSSYDVLIDCEISTKIGTVSRYHRQYYDDKDNRMLIMVDMLAYFTGGGPRFAAFVLGLEPDPKCSG